MLAPVTPGRARTRSSSARAETASGTGASVGAGGAAARGMLTRSVSSEAASNPGWSADRFRTLRIINPAPTRSAIASETSATTSALRTRCDRRPLLPRAESLSASLSRDTRPCSAGARPRTMPHASETRIVKSAARTSIRGTTKLGNVSGLAATIARTATAASSRPAAAPTSVNTQLSVINCRSRRGQPAPRAERTAISRWRASDRAISRLAMLAHAMSSTNPTAAISARSAGRNGPNSSVSSGLSSTPRFSLVSGYACSSCRQIASISPCARSRETPSFKRAST